jgi:hypothetical protein
MANYADDFESYGTGAGIPTGYTGRWNYASGEWSRVTDTDVAIRHIETSIDRGIVTYDAVDSDGTRADCELLVRFKGSVGIGSLLRGGVVARASGSAASETGYTCGISDTELRIGRYRAGVSTQIAITSGLGLGTGFYWIRFRVNGTGATVTLQAKIWADGGSEPGSWNLNTTDTSADRVTAAGWCGLFSFSDSTKVWRDLAVATNGDTATMGGAGAQTLTASLYTNTETFYTATLAAGAVTLSPALVSNSNAFYSHTLTLGFTLLPSLFTNSNVIYSASVAVGAVTLSPARFDNTNAFYAATVSQIGGVSYPSADINANGWTPSSGSDLYAMIDETVLNRSDYITSPNLSNPVTLSWNPPRAVGNHDVSVDFDRTGADGQLRIVMLDSSGTTVGTSAWQAAPSSAATTVFTITTTGISDRFRIEVQP